MSPDTDGRAEPPVSGVTRLRVPFGGTDPVTPFVFSHVVPIRASLSDPVGGQMWEGTVEDVVKYATTAHRVASVVPSARQLATFPG